jgi:hypothetical protein
MVHFAQTKHLSCVRLALSPTDRNKLSLEPCHLGVLSGASKMISDPMLHLAQTKNLSSTNKNTVSKQIETWFDMTHVTYEFHRVGPKRLLSLRYVWRKPCTYLESRLALSLNGPKRASTWASSPRNTIGCIQNGFWPYGILDANHPPIVHQR